jgi:hypothetical protein
MIDLFWFSVVCFTASLGIVVIFEIWSRRSAEIAKERLKLQRLKQEDDRLVEEMRIKADERKHQYTVSREAEAKLKVLTEGIDAQLADVKKQLSHISMREARGGFGGAR